MTRQLFIQDPYLRESTATLTGHTREGGVILDQSIFFPTGGGQPGDSGQIDWDGGMIQIASAIEAGQGASPLCQPNCMPCQRWEQGCNR